MKIDPNDPAMPCPNSTERHAMVGGDPVIKFDKHNQGLTIRAELAARAMQGLLANGDAERIVRERNDSGTSYREWVIKASTIMADMLIERLNKTQEQ